MTLNSDPVLLGSVTTDAVGRFNASFTIPATTPAGAHTVTVGGTGAAASISVVLGAPLPVTGPPTTALALISLSLCFGGAVLLAGRRLGIVNEEWAKQV